jgi:hypothetical protein
MAFKIHPAVLFALALLFLGACMRGDIGKEIIPPATPPLSRDMLGYGVVSLSYTHILKTRGDERTAVGILRQGTVVRALARQPVIKDGNAESWVLAASGTLSGWINEQSLLLYDTLAQAKTAAGRLTAPITMEKSELH